MSERARSFVMVAVVAWCLTLAACERDPVLLRSPRRSTMDASLACGPNAFPVGGTPAFPGCACLPGFVGDGFVCVPVEPLCAPDTDTDTDTASFTITHLGVPMGDGFNLDGMNNGSPPQGTGVTVAGCGKFDLTGGVDNALVALGTLVGSVTDVADSLQASLAHAIPDGGTSGQLGLFVVLSHLVAANAAHDSCVTIDLVVTMPGRPLRSARGTGSLTNNVVFAILQEDLPLPFVPDVSPESCNGSACVPTVLELLLRGGRVRLTLDPTHTRLLSGSILGGFLFFNDCAGAPVSGSGCTGGFFDDANASGVQSAVSAWAVEANLTATSQALLVQGFAGARDLHMHFDGSLSPCTGANISGVDRNSVSVAFAFDSE